MKKLFMFIVFILSIPAGLATGFIIALWTSTQIG